MKLYWSCSKFADWLRGTAKPQSGTAEEWDAWKQIAKKKKFRYWLTEEFLDYLEDFVCWPASRIIDIRSYFNNRFIRKSHALTSNLKRGSWHDFDTRLLHAAFDELVNFVEIEQAWMFVVFSNEDRKKYKTPWHRTFLRIGLWRCPAAGIAYLNWAASLKISEENSSNFDQPTSQALAAQETLALYNWWKHERPNRPEPSDCSVLTKYSEENPITSKIARDDKLAHEILDIYHQLEKEQEEEDTAMLIRLVKIRQNLWT